MSDDQSERGSSVDQSEPFSRHATRDGTADSIKDRRLHSSPFPSTTQCGAAQRRSVERRKNTSVFRDYVTEATPGDKGVTYIQVRVID